MDLGPTVFFGTNCSNSSAERYISSPPQGFFVFTDSIVASRLHHRRLCNAIGSTVRWLRRHHCCFYCCSRFILYPIGFPFRWTSITLSYSQTKVFLIGNIKSFSPFVNCVLSWFIVAGGCWHSNKFISHWNVCRLNI